MAGGGGGAAPGRPHGPPPPGGIWTKKKAGARSAVAAMLEHTLFLERVHDFLGHVILVMLGEDLGGDEDPAIIRSGADHALILGKEIGQQPLEGDRHRRAAIGDAETHGLALAAPDAAL